MSAIAPSRVGECLAKLIAGEANAPSPATGGDLIKVLGVLQNNVERLSTEALLLCRASKSGDADAGTRLELYGPFLGRGILEICLTAALARLDPIRVLTLARYQVEMEQSARLTRTNLAVQWTGDLIAKREKNTPEEGQGPSSSKQGFDWAKNITPERIVRALIGGHLSELCLGEGFENLIANRDLFSSGLLDRFIDKTSTAQLLPRLAAMCDGKFSFWSKGIHSELLIDRRALFDSPTVITNLVETMFIASVVGVLTSLCHIAFAKFDAKECATHFNAVAAEIESF
jgi:hypothetical protein